MFYAARFVCDKWRAKHFRGHVIIRPMTRFHEQDVTVIDRHTGLMWPRDAAACEFPLTWNEALDMVRSWNLSRQFGYDDWKLPNRRELFSLVSHDTINPCLAQGHPFVNVFSGYYWTSTTCRRLPDQAWYIHMGGARVFKGMKYGSYMVWPVRVAHEATRMVRSTGQTQCYDDHGVVIECRGTGQDGEYRYGINTLAARFSEEGDIIHDQSTGLTWLKDANHFGAPTHWRNALDLLKDMNHKDQPEQAAWRMPTILEFDSLLDLGEHSPALPAGHPFVNVRNHYWSATTSRYDAGYAWALYMQDGILGVGYKTLPEFHLWPVKGGAGA